MPSFLVVTLVALAALLIGLVVAGRVRRRRLVAEIAQQGVLKSAPAVTCGLLVHGTTKLLGFEPDTVHHLDVDLVLTTSRFAVVCGRGMLVDARVDGARLTSARCTGPGRLVIEGDIAAPRAVRPTFRLELTVPDAEAWALATAPFVDQNGVPFASFSPVAAPS